MDMHLFYRPELWKGATGLASSAATPPKTLQTKRREQLLLTVSPWPPKLAVPFIAHAKRLTKLILMSSDLPPAGSSRTLPVFFKPSPYAHPFV